VTADDLVIDLRGPFSTRPAFLPNVELGQCSFAFISGIPHVSMRFGLNCRDRAETSRRTGPGVRGKGRLSRVRRTIHCAASGRQSSSLRDTTGGRHGLKAGANYSPRCRSSSRKSPVGARSVGDFPRIMAYHSRLCRVRKRGRHHKLRLLTWWVATRYTHRCRFPGAEMGPGCGPQPGGVSAGGAQLGRRGARCGSRDR